MRTQVAPFKALNDRYPYRIQTTTDHRGLLSYPTPLGLMSVFWAESQGALRDPGLCYWTSLRSFSSHTREEKGRKRIAVVAADYEVPGLASDGLGEWHFA